MTERARSSPDVDEIAAQLEAQLNLQRLEDRNQAHGQPADPLSGLRARQWVNPHLPIGWPEMPPGVRPKLLALTQKIVRRLLRWYINPLVAQQNEFNEAVVSALQDLYRHVARETALVAARHEAAQVEFARQRVALAAQSPTGALGSPCAPSWFMAAPPPAPPERLDGMLQRALFGQQMRGDALPLLIVGDAAGELAIRARAVGLAAEALPVFDTTWADRPAASLTGILWVTGVWRYDAAACQRLLAVAEQALAPGAPLVVETVDPANAAALTRHVWTDPVAVRPYAPELLLALLRDAGLEGVTALEPSQGAVVLSVCGYRGQG